MGTAWQNEIWQKTGMGHINFPLCLAPMVGLTHGALRAVVRHYTPAGARTLWPTEMLSSRKLPNQNLGSTPETIQCLDDIDLHPQILGNEERPIAQSLEKLIPWGAKSVDINMGCPVQKALRHNYGVSLMGDPVYAQEVVKMTVRNSSIPISVKLRAGLQNDFEYLKNFVLGLQDSGASWITLHPRTAEQKRRGEANWQQIKALKKALAIPLIGNGDVQTEDDVFRMLDSTGCDLVMSGRALAARPWLMWQVGETLGFSPPSGLNGRAPRTPVEEGAEFGRALMLFIDQCEQMFEPDLALRKIRFYLRTTSPWLLFGHELESRSTRVKTLEGLREQVCEFFSTPQEMMPKTQLRQ